MKRLLAIIVAGVLMAMAVGADEGFGPGPAVTDPDYDDGASGIAEDGSPIIQEVLVPDLSKIEEDERIDLWQEVLNQLSEDIVLEAPEDLVLEGYPFELLSEELDGDQDGLSDVQEVEMGTQADNPDTDGDTYADGLEVVNGFDPTKASPGDEVIYENPQDIIGAIDLRLAITGVRLIGVNADLLVVTGTAPANSLVLVLIYSDEAVRRVVRADPTGRFKYSSEVDLADGSHEVYVVLPSVNGSLVFISKSFSFERQGDEILVEKKVVEAALVGAGESDAGKGVVILVVLALILLVVGIISGFLIWHWVKRAKKKVREVVTEVVGRKNIETESSSLEE